MINYLVCLGNYLASYFLVSGFKFSLAWKLEKNCTQVIRYFLKKMFTWLLWWDPQKVLFLD